MKCKCEMVLSNGTIHHESVMYAIEITLNYAFTIKLHIIQLGINFTHDERFNKIMKYTYILCNIQNFRPIYYIGLKFFISYK